MASKLVTNGEEVTQKTHDATTTALNLPELLADIMLHLDFNDIQRARSVAWVWESTYQGSLALRRKGILQPTTNLESKELVRYFYMFRSEYVASLYPDYSGKEIVIHPACTAPTLKNRPRSGFSTRVFIPLNEPVTGKNAFCTSPPCRAVAVEVEARSVSDSSGFRSSLEIQRATVYNMEGVRVSDVLGTVTVLGRQAIGGHIRGARAMLWTHSADYF